MLVSHEREKLINTIIFFAERVRFFGKIKMFKLLYFLDFEHYRDTGRSVTGLSYYAWKMGPVPVELMDEVEEPEPDMGQKITFSEIKVQRGTMLKIEPLDTFDNSHFTRRELRLMERLAEEFKDSKADEMVEATHLENLPWHKVFVDQRRPQQLIPYDYAIRAQESDVMAPLIAERQAIVEHFQLAKA